ncbi:hypothetical protein Poli38472_014728 [Pythium oligandrum]|uniref:Uncharacterized protein n=1 Tax=Pythium oligandrum TaxID=41045 RepID=A0A8K1C2H5_PYTOL|nr:hypothetical protein Poli38472_014728 [Pythium oligandrum]|eukprot:TMW54957.1 hypothetical protein Poli38472_014728 [Pythium oligandrum]
MIKELKPAAPSADTCEKVHRQEPTTETFALILVFADGSQRHYEEASSRDGNRENRGYRELGTLLGYWSSLQP